MKKITSAIIFLVIINFVSATCGDGQIDINSASVEELDEITWVGLATAEKMINTRPFESLDDLTKVSGIGEVKLGDIKEQGLACVNEEIEIEESYDEEKEEEEVVNSEKGNEIKKEEEKLSMKEEEKVEMITLSPKDIKSEGDTFSDKAKYITYGFVVFCLLIAGLSVLKLKKKDELE
jgi:hypothetical protein